MTLLQKLATMERLRAQLREARDGGVTKWAVLATVELVFDEEVDDAAE